jgi:hypothetical protein
MQTLFTLLFPFFGSNDAATKSIHSHQLPLSQAIIVVDVVSTRATFSVVSRT